MRWLEQHIVASVVLGSISFRGWFVRILKLWPAPTPSLICYGLGGKTRNRITRLSIIHCTDVNLIAPCRSLALSDRCMCVCVVWCVCVCVFVYVVCMCVNGLCMVLCVCDKIRMRGMGAAAMEPHKKIRQQNKNKKHQNTTPSPQEKKNMRHQYIENSFFYKPQR